VYGTARSSFALIPVRQSPTGPPADLVNSLQGVEQAGPAPTAASLWQMAVQSMKDPSRASRINRAPLVGDLEKRSQLTIAIQFNLNSAVINPASFQVLGLTDALYHPYLQGYRFLIVGRSRGTVERRRLRSKSRLAQMLGFRRRADQVATGHENAMTTNRLAVLGRLIAIMTTVFSLRGR
jgi:hypothetical protein